MFAVYQIWRPDFSVSFDTDRMSGESGKSGDAEWGLESLVGAPGDPAAERRQRLHEANNRLAAVIMNLAFARATLAACPADGQLTELELADIRIALEHAEDAANRLASVIRELG
jgi:hypothetical protein